MISANYFDGQSARLHPVKLQAADGALIVMGGAITQSYAYAQVKMAEQFAHTPTVLYFADGGHCEVTDRAGGQTLADALGYRKSAVACWQQRWYAALAALALLVGAGIFVAFRAVPAVAEQIAAEIPSSLDQQIGDSALRGMEANLLAPSRLSDQRIAEVEQVLRAIAPAQPRQPLRLLVRNAPKLGPNAFALPNGTILVTDEMILYILGKASDFDERRRAQLAGTLAHEIGHIQGRHSVRVLARSSLMAAGSAALFGDFSAVAAGVPAVLMSMHYSRGMESDADTYAIALLAQKGISTGPLADLFDALESEYEADLDSDLPRWLSESMAYMSSHPASAQRSARLRKAALH